MLLLIFCFYPTALKGCRGIVFTDGVRMGGRAAGKVCPGCISETVSDLQFGNLVWAISRKP